MKKIMFLFAFLLSATTLLAQVTIKGTVIGADSKPIQNGIVAFTKGENATYNESKPITNGKFEIVFTSKESTIFFLVGAPYHSPITITLPANEEKVIELDVKLQALELPADGVRFISEAGGLDFEKSLPMLKNADGTYKYEIETSAKTLKYQLMYSSDYQGQPQIRTSHGTLGELSEDKAGDYYSTIPVVNGKATIIFDPSKLIKPANEYYARVTSEPMKTKIELQQTYAKIEREYYGRLLGYQQTNKTQVGFEFDVSKWKNLLFSYRAKNTDPKMQLLFDAYYIQSKSFFESDPKEKANYDTKVAENFFKNVPYSNPVWTASGEVLTPVLSIVFGNDVEKKFQEVIKFCKEDVKLDEKYRVYSALLYETKGTNIHRDVYEKALGDLKGYPYLKQLSFEHNPDKRIENGKLVPDFEIASIDNENQKISNKSLKGQYYLIDFWATWCGPCMAEMGNLHQVYEKFKGKKGFTIVSLSYDASPDKVIEHRKKGKFPMPWNHGFVQDGFESSLGQTFEVAGIPSVVLVDDKGTIIATSSELRGASLENTLKKFLE
jgi:thiol-disulfide isomerase/thioredoxin